MRKRAGWTEGMTVYVRWHDGLRQCTLSRLRDADDGSQDLSVPPGLVRVRMPGDGAHDVPWALVSSSLELGAKEARLVLRRDGAEVMRGTEGEIWTHIHRNCPYSVSHACRYEGYSIEPEGLASGPVAGGGGEP